MSEEKVVRRGEVWWVGAGINVGSEVAMGRPGVIVSSDTGNEKSRTAIVVYMTTKPLWGNVTPKVRVGDNSRWVLCHQLTTVDQSRLERKDGALTPEDMAKVDAGLTVALDVTTTPEPKQSDDVTALRCEIDLWRRMYETTMDQLVELKVAQVVAQRTNRVVMVEAPEKKSEHVGLIVDDLVPETRVVKSALVEPDPGFEEESAPEEPKKSKVVWDGVKVNVNTVVSGQELKRRTGMNTRTATEIVKTRDVVGNYEKLEDLLALDHFGDLSMKRYGHMLTVVDEPAEAVEGTEKKNNPE